MSHLHRLSLLFFLLFSACGLPVARAQTAAAADSVVLIRTANSLLSSRGSGFVAGDGSWVVTASHVVAVDLGKGRRGYDRTALVYSPWTGRPYEARVAAIDPVADVAVLRLPQAGLPALPIEGLEVRDAPAALAALKDRPLRLYGFPLAYGEATIAALARAEHNDSTLREIARRGETNLCVMNACPDVKPGWSGGPMVGQDRGAVVAVFHSLYRPKPDDEAGFPAGSVAGYLGELLTRAGAGDLGAFARPAPPTVLRPEKAAECMAHEMRGLAWAAAGELRKAEGEQRELLRLLPTDVMARVELGRLLLLQKRDDEALKVLEEAAKLAPRSMLANLYLGRALHRNYETKRAVAALRAAQEASPGEVEPQLTLAEVQEDTERAQESEATLRAALQSAPTHPGILLQLGNLLLHSGRGAEGMKLLGQAADLGSSEPALSHVPLGWARALEFNRKFREAEGAYRGVIRQNPENFYAHYYLAQMFLNTRRIEDAQLAISGAFKVRALSDEMVEALQALQQRINERGVTQ